MFLINSASFVAVIAALACLRVDELHRDERAARKPGSFLEGFRYVRGRPDLLTVLGMLFLIMTFGINFPVFISTMAVTVFHAGSGKFGLLSSMLAIGSVTGALFAARREKPRVTLLLAGAAIFGFGLAAAALMPTYILFGLVLVLVGWSAQTFNTTANSTVQLFTEPVMRGRVMAIYMAIAMGVHAARRAARGVGGRHVRAALVAGARGILGFPRGVARHLVSRAPSRIAPALRGRPPAPHHPGIRPGCRSTRSRLSCAGDERHEIAATRRTPCTGTRAVHL